MVFEGACTEPIATFPFPQDAIRSARPKYNLRTALSEREHSRLANATARARDYNYFVLHSR